MPYTINKRVFSQRLRCKTGAVITVSVISVSLAQLSFAENVFEIHVQGQQETAMSASSDLLQGIATVFAALSMAEKKDFNNAQKTLGIAVSKLSESRGEFDRLAEMKESAKIRYDKKSFDKTAFMKALTAQHYPKPNTVSDLAAIAKQEIDKYTKVVQNISLGKGPESRDTIPAMVQSLHTLMDLGIEISKAADTIRG